MAIIRKGGDSYSIRVSCGYDTNGKHKEQAMTWKPEPGMTKRQTEKALQGKAVLFEKSVAHGYKTTAVKFEELRRGGLRNMHGSISETRLMSE